MHLTPSLVRWASLSCLLPWTGLAQIANGDFEIDRFGAAGITTWTGTASILGQPDGSPLIPPFNTPPPPIGSSGNCAAGIASGGVLRQTLVGEAGRGYTLSFSAKSLSGMAAVGRLRVRASRPDSTVLAERVPTLQSGGTGTTGFSRYTLDVPVLDATGPLVVEFANSQTLDSSVAVDDVGVSASQPSAPPILATPEKVFTQGKIAWTNPPSVTSSSAPPAGVLVGRTSPRPRFGGRTAGFSCGWGIARPTKRPTSACRPGLSPDVSCLFVARRSESPAGKASEAIRSRAV